MSKKVKPGQTLVKLEEGKSLSGDDKARRDEFGEWEYLSAEGFQVRQGPDYEHFKLKGPSKEAIYEPFAVDVYYTKNKIKNIGRFFDFSGLDTGTVSAHFEVKDDGVEELDSASPSAATTASSAEIASPSATLSDEGMEFAKTLTLPKIVVVNVLCPLYAPSMFGSSTDGEGFNTIAFFKLTDASKKILTEQDCMDDIPPSMKLMSDFVTRSADKDMRSRFKAIGKAVNHKELNFGRILEGLIDSYNAKPFLVQEGTSAYFYNEAEYWEVDVDIHMFGSIARNGFYHLKSTLQKIQADFGFLIESRENDEMPEQVMGCFRCFNVNNLKAKPFPITVAKEK